MDKAKYLHELEVALIANDYSLEESKKYTKKDLRFVRRYDDINH